MCVCLFVCLLICESEYFFEAVSMFVVCARYGVPGAQSEGVFAADQPTSAKARFAAPQRNPGKVRWVLWLKYLPTMLL